MDDEISRVGLYGMSGVGKTTIATRINDRLITSVNYFSLVCWVTISKDLSICNIQNKIAEMIQLVFSKEDDEQKRAAKLRKKLKTEKFVLILDDVWEAFQIEDAGIPSLINGQKLFMTSRSRRVCEMMECQPIEVKPLFEKDALDLFVKESKCKMNERDIVDSIVKECDGLPLAIVVIARRMKGVKEIWKWRSTLRELQKPCEGENPQFEDKVFKVLKFSYDRLPNDKCRQCFLYCSLFPEDYEFKRNDLIEYWIGEGLVDELESTFEELDKSNCILDELIHASLLEIVHDSFKRIKMHDVIRDMTHMNVKVGLQFENSLESVQALRMLKRFTNSTPHYSKLTTLLLQGIYTMQLPGYFFANMQRLNVLHMTDVRDVKSISDSIANLKNLRLLIISGCFQLECIPSLAGLEKLRHLNVSRNERLKEIPEGIEGLVNLRVLDLSANKSLIGSFPCGVVEKLSHLQTLNLRGSRVQVESEALISFEKLEVLKIHFYNLLKLNYYVKSGHWQILVEYHIHCGEHIVPNWDQKMCLKIMSFKAIREAEERKGEFDMILPDDIQYLKLVDWQSPMFNVLQNPTFVHLKSINICSYKSRYLFTVEFAQHLLHNVKYLRIDGCDELEEIIGRGEEWVKPSNYLSHPTILLSNLKSLKLGFLGELRSIYRGRIVCPSLELIQIYGCDKVERLPFCMKKEGNKQNPTIQLVMDVIRWESLQWDDPDAKSMYLPIFDSESEFDGES